MRLFPLSRGDTLAIAAALVVSLTAALALSLGASALAAQPTTSQPTTSRPAAPPRAAEPALASYVSSRLNGKPLPVTDRATDDGGVQYLIEFDELILSVRPNHEFRASLRFRQTLAAKGSQLARDPIQKMIVFGTWAAVDGELRFVPDPTRGGKGLRILSGTFSGVRIEVPFDYRNGTVSRRANVVLLKNDNIF